MREAPLVSILIPCFNSERTIERCIESCLSQTYSPIEVIVTDDGSQDESRQLLERFKDPRVIVHAQPNLGASVARNNCYRQSKGDFLQYLDADDYLHPEKIERQMSVMMNLESRTVLAAGRWTRVYPDGKVVQPKADATFRITDPAEWLIQTWISNSMMHPAAWLTPRQLHESAGYWDESLTLNDDGEFFARVLLGSDEIIHVPEALSFYTSGDHSSLSARKTQVALRSWYSSIEKSVQRLLQVRSDKVAKHAAACAYLQFAYSTYPDAPELVMRAETEADALSDLQVSPSGSKLFHLFRYFFGWKVSKRILQVMNRGK